MKASPREGAWNYKLTFEGNPAVRPGWNKQIFDDGRPPSYMFLDFSGMHAHQTPNLPDGVDEGDVNTFVIPLPTDARESDLWSDAESLVSSLKGFGSKLPPGLRPISATMRSMAKFAPMLRTKDALMAFSMPLNEKLIKGVDLTVPNGPDPALRAASAFMRFEVPGLVARYQLATLYTSFYRVISERPDVRCAPIKLMIENKIHDLANAAYRLRQDRATYNVSGFFNATYLALLFAGAVLVLCSPDAKLEQYGFTRDECDRLLRFRQNIDELIAHDLAAPFTLPARFRSKAALIWVSHLAGRLGKSPLEMADHYCVHPALASVLESANWESMDDEEIERCYRSNVSGKPGPGIDDLIANEQNVIRLRAYDYIDR